MKKTLVFTLLCALLLGMAGCGGGGGGKEFITLVCDGGKEITLGMTKDAIDKKIGAGEVTASDSDGSTVKYADVSVEAKFNRAGNAIQFSILDEPTETALKVGINRNMSKDEIRAVADTDPDVTLIDGIDLVFNKTVNGEAYTIVCSYFGGNTLYSLLLYAE